jgi:hypothetical protein
MGGAPSAPSHHGAHETWICSAGAGDSYTMPACKDLATYIGHPGLPSPERDRPHVVAPGLSVTLVRVLYCLLLCDEGEMD